jgi:hypothetical protein
MMVQMASSNTLIQSMVPDQLRGRIMAVYSMMFMEMAPFGALFAGFLANHVGAPTTLALGGAICIAEAIRFGQRVPGLRHEGRELLSRCRRQEALPPIKLPGRRRLRLRQVSWLSRTNDVHAIQTAQRSEKKE